MGAVPQRIMLLRGARSVTFEWPLPDRTQPVEVVAAVVHEDGFLIPDYHGQHWMKVYPDKVLLSSQQAHDRTNGQINKLIKLVKKWNMAQPTPLRYRFNQKGKKKRKKIEKKKNKKKNRGGGGGGGGG